MQNITYENLIEKISEMFPEFLQTNFFRKDEAISQYSSFAGFIEYIVDSINKADKLTENDEVKKAFTLINYMINQGDKLENLAVVEGIEGLVQEKKSKIVAEKLLNNKGKEHMIDVLKHTGIE